MNSPSCANRVKEAVNWDWELWKALELAVHVGSVIMPSEFSSSLPAAPVHAKADLRQISDRDPSRR